MRGDDHQVWAFLPRLPQCFAGLDFVLLCKIVLRQDDSVAVVHTAAHRHGHVPKLGVAHFLHCGVEMIHITMENNPVQYARLHSLTQFV